MLSQELKKAFVASAEDLAKFPQLVSAGQTLIAPSILETYQQMLAERGGEADLAGRIVAQSGFTLPQLLGYEADAYGEWASTAFVAAQQFSFNEVLKLTVLLTRIAFVVPEATFAVMDAISEGWLRGKATRNLAEVNWAELRQLPLEKVQERLNLTAPAPRFPETLAGLRFEAQRSIPLEVQRLFWEEVEVVPGTTNIIEKVTAFAGGYDDTLRQAYNTAMSAHRGIKEAYQDGYLRQSFRIEDLRGCPPGTLGYGYYHQIVDNGLEAEILKNHQLVKINTLTDYIGRRILQTHDLWHVVTEYTTNGLDEIALQAFQLAQLGSPFSSNLQAMLMTRSALLDPQTIPYFMGAISEGWQHGRKTLPFLPIHWEEDWNTPVEELRQRYRIEPFKGDLMAAV